MLFETVYTATNVLLSSSTAETGSPAGNCWYSPEQGSTAPNAHSASGSSKNNNTGYLGGNASGSLNKPGLHSGGANYLLSDGHVKYLLGSQVSPGFNNSTGPTGFQGTNNGTSYCAAGTGGPITSGGTNYPIATFSAI